MARGAGGGNYLRELSILKYFRQRGVIIQERLLFERWLLFEEIRYLTFYRKLCA